MQRVHILRRTFSSAPRVQSKAEDILSSYPIRLLGPTEDRRGYFEKYPGAPWHERAILMPLRLKMASAAGTGFLNNRFGTPPSSLPSASQTPEFFPTQFEEGVLQALPAVVKTLSGWNGDVDSQQGRRLAHYVTPGLLDRLSSVHKDIDAKGYALNLKWVEGDEDDLQVVPKHFWITFGEPSLATSTLLRGKVVSRYHIVAFTRKVIDSDRRLFREICFEYCYREGEWDGDDDIDDDGVMVNIPDFQWKRKVMLLGQRVGIDSDVSGASIKYSLVKKEDGEDVESGTMVVDDMGVRLETSHFVDDFPEDGYWRVADLDNWLVHERVLEEEKGL